MREPGGVAGGTGPDVRMEKRPEARGPFGLGRDGGGEFLKQLAERHTSAQLAQRGQCAESELGGDLMPGV